LIWVLISKLVEMILDWFWWLRSVQHWFGISFD